MDDNKIMNLFRNGEWFYEKRTTNTRILWYTERCDYEICKLLKDKGIHLPFTKYDEEIVVKQYYGRVKEWY